jgi:hypothetical protein
MKRGTRTADLGFLHAFYYQTPQNSQTPRKIHELPRREFEGAPTAAVNEALSAIQKRQ